jgi:hypothetical protein
MIPLSVKYRRNLCGGVSTVNRGKRGSRMFNDASGKIENLMGMMCRDTVGERDRGRAPVPEFL